MNVSFIFGLGLSAISIFLPYVFKSLPALISKLGLCIGLALTILSAIYWLTRKMFYASSNTQKPNLILLYENNKLNLHNKGLEDVYLWGTKFASEPAQIEKKSRVIPVGCFYYFLIDRLESFVKPILEKSGEKLFPLEIYISDSFKDHYIAKFALLIKNGKKLIIHTQQMGIKKEKWDCKNHDRVS